MAFADSRIVPKARIDVAIPNHIAAFRLKWAVGDVICQFDHLDRLAQLLMIGKSTRWTAVHGGLAVDDAHCLRVGVDRACAGFAGLGVSLFDVSPARVPEPGEGDNDNEAKEDRRPPHRSPS